MSSAVAYRAIIEIELKNLENYGLLFWKDRLIIDDVRIAWFARWCTVWPASSSCLSEGQIRCNGEKPQLRKIIICVLDFNIEIMAGTAWLETGVSAWRSR